MLDIELMPSNLDMGFENKQNEIEFKAPETNVNIDNNYENAKNKPSINGVELIGNKITEDLKLIYSKLLGLPTLNGKTIVGDLTTEDLGINIDTSNFITIDNAIKNFDIELTYEEEDYYTANAIHQLMEVFGFEIMNLVEVLDNHEERLSALEN